MTIQIGAREYEPQAATRIKAHEQSRLNSFWYDVTEERGNLNALLNRNLVYLWILREDEHLILGHEDDQNLGHPSLAVNWTPTGEIQANGVPCYIGGELKRDRTGWRIDNNSGRYGSAPGTGKKTLLQRVATKFQTQGSLAVRVYTYSRKGWKRFIQHRFY